ADIADQTRLHADARLFHEHVAHRVVVVEIADGLDLKVWPVETGAESDLARKTPSGIIPRRVHDPSRGIPPFRNAPVIPKPVVVLRKVIALEADNRRDQPNPIGRLRI